MAQLHFNIDDGLKSQFTNRVGYGKMNDWLRDSIKAYLNFNEKKKQTRNDELELKLLLKQKEDISAAKHSIEKTIENFREEYEKIKGNEQEIDLKIMEIESARRQREIADLQAQKAEEEQRKKDSLADLKRKQDFVDAYMRAGQQ